MSVGAGTVYSARSYVLAWILIPVVLIIGVDTFALYRSALRSVGGAYDRTLLATAHAVGDAVRYEQGRFRVSLPLALFEVYEATQSGRYYYRISTHRGELISGDEDMPLYEGEFPRRAAYPSVVQFYETEFRGQRVRVAALEQPVFSGDDAGRVVIQVAEPLAIRETSARDILEDTLLRQGLLLLVVAIALFVSVKHGLKSLYELRRELDQRSVDDLSAITLRPTIREVSTVIQALNALMMRFGRLVNYQKRFIANASHQLRTPLAVLKTQVQSGLRGDVPAQDVMREMEATVDRAVQLANQMLMLAKIEQQRSLGPHERCHLDKLARAAVLELSPLIAEKNLDFEITSEDAQFMGNAWLVGELLRNLLSNAIRHTPEGGRLGIDVARRDGRAILCLWDSGGGIPDTQQQCVFAPFASFSHHGTGLGLAICKEIVDTLGGEIDLTNRVEEGLTVGLEARVTFPAV